MESVMTSVMHKPGTRGDGRPNPVFQSAFRNPHFAIHNPQSAIAFLLLATLFIFTGCARGPAIIAPELRKPIDRSLVERPANFDIERFIINLTAPTAMAFDTGRNTLLVAESGVDGSEPRILGFDLDEGTTFRVYPQGKVLLGLRSIPFRMYGPIGGMAVRDGVIYVSHRDANGMGVISAVGYDGKGSTVIGGLPAQGDYGVTDLAFHPTDGRLFFGVGSATNSGVVGLDNWQVGWVQQHPNLADKLYAPPGQPVRLLGSKFFTNNPHAGLFTGSELAITAPLQPFGEYYRSRIEGPPSGKPNAAIYSIQPTGGVSAPDLRIEAHGIRMPAGLAFVPTFHRLYATSQGMEMRGTRPVRDDPNTVLLIPSGGARWWGFPDYSADLAPISEARFQPPQELLRKTGNNELFPLLDHSGAYSPPDESDRENLVRAVFPSLSGASKMTFIPDEGPLSVFSRQLIVTLSGDRAPFATSGKLKLREPVGYKVVSVDFDSDTKAVRDFIRNTANLPRSKTPANSPETLERPIDVKVGPDGYLYVLDFGRLDVSGGKNRVTGRTGQVFRLLPVADSKTTPAADSPRSALTTPPDADPSDAQDR